MELGGSVRVFSVNKTTPYLIPTDQHSNAVCRGQCASFRARRSSVFRATLKENSSSRGIESVANTVSIMSDEVELSSLTALCPLDGRYWGKVKELAPYMSEFGLIRFRILVEIKWLLKLSQIPEVSEVPSFSREAEFYLQNLSEVFNMDDAMEVKKIERVINHDVKAVEYFLKQKCHSQP